GGGVIGGIQAQGGRQGGPGANPVGLIGTLVQLAQSVVFIVFLRQSALTLREYGLARSLVFLLVYSITAVLIIVALVFAMELAAASFFAAGGGDGAAISGAAIALVVIVIILALGMFIWYL